MISEPVITKFFIPPVRSNIVPRPNLVEKISKGLDNRLTLVSAPAGFGKSTLLSELAAVAKIPMAWLSLDQQDNDPQQFWAYILGSINKIHEDLGVSIFSGVQINNQVSLEASIPNLINEIVRKKTPHFVLVLEDYHVIDLSEIHEMITYLVDYLPPQLHLIISTRSDPPVPLGRWRARGLVNELRAADLRFSYRETETLLNRLMDLNLSESDISLLESRTEGWITGLQLAGISMKGKIAAGRANDLHGFVERFTGSHRFVLDYLIEEVIDQQTPEIRIFLLQTSILDCFSADLCQVLTGNKESYKILEEIDRSNLFLVPLDEEHRFFRYHYLFSDLLRTRLNLSHPDQVSNLHQAASGWYEENGLLAEAMKHALMINDVERVARLIAGNAIFMIYLGELTTLEYWLRKLPETLMQSSPWLNIAHAWVKVYAGHYNAVDQLLADAEIAISDKDEETSKEITGHVELIRAFTGFYQGNYERGIEYARSALRNLGHRNKMISSYANSLLGGMLINYGNLDEGGGYIQEGIELSRETGLYQLIVDALSDKISLRLMQGRLEEVMVISSEALKMDDIYQKRFGKHLLAMGVIYYALSAVYYSKNHLEEALSNVKIGLEIARQWQRADHIALCYSGLSAVYLAQGDVEEAEKAIGQCRRIASEISEGWRWFGSIEEARFHLEVGNIDKADQLAKDCKLKVSDTVHLTNASQYLFFAKLLTAQEKNKEALQLLERLEEIAEKIGVISTLIPVWIAKVLVLQKQEENAQAFDVLSRALSLAEREGIIRLFIDKGSALYDLLKKAEQSGHCTLFVSKILLGVSIAMQKEERSGRWSQFVDPLSGRELEVLRFLTSSLTHTEIAELLYVSKHTVRSHVKSIYSKLDVHNRLEAIDKAKELGLI